MNYVVRQNSLEQARRAHARQSGVSSRPFQRCRPDVANNMFLEQRRHFLQSRTCLRAKGASLSEPRMNSGLIVDKPR